MLLYYTVWVLFENRDLSPKNASFPTHTYCTHLTKKVYYYLFKSLSFTVTLSPSKSFYYHLSIIPHPPKGTHCVTPFIFIRFPSVYCHCHLYLLSILCLYFHVNLSVYSNPILHMSLKLSLFISCIIYMLYLNY